MMDDLTAPKMPPLMKMAKSCTPWLCVIAAITHNRLSIASEVGISFGAVQSILTDILGMSKVSARWVPRMLTDDQKRTPLDISRYLLSCLEDDPSDFMGRVEVQDETWFTTLKQSKMQSKQWKHPCSPTPKKFKRVHSAGKVMASIFRDS